MLNPDLNTNNWDIPAYSAGQYLENVAFLYRQFWEIILFPVVVVSLVSD